MSYIIVWRSNHREPFLESTDHGFKEEYYSYEDAKAEAERIQKIENEDTPSRHYHDYEIFESIRK